jgi:hypothetical protein
MQFKIKHFNRNKDLIELHLTQTKASNTRQFNWGKTMGNFTAPSIIIVRQHMDVICERYSFARQPKKAVPTLDHALKYGTV